MGIVRVMEKGDHVKGAIVRKMKKKTNLGFAAFCDHSIIKGWLLYILGSRTGGVLLWKWLDQWDYCVWESDVALNGRKGKVGFQLQAIGKTA